MLLTHNAMLIRDERPVPEPYLLVCVLGGFQLLHTGDPVPLSKKEVALLAALAVHGTTGVRRDALLSELWPERERPLAGRSLHTLTWGLHRRLGDVLGSTPLVVHAHETYALNTWDGIAVDALLFEQLIDQGDVRARIGDQHGATDLYSRAAALYRGDLFAGAAVAADLIIERERLRGRFQDLLTRVATAAYERDDLAACLRFAQRLLTTDPFHEGMHRLVMRCYARLGERSRALHQYDVCAALLRDEFQVAPEVATTVLFEAIRSDSATLDRKLTGT